MKCHLVLPVCLLLLWTPTESKEVSKIQVATVSDGIKLSCKDNDLYKGDHILDTNHLSYNDENTGEYVFKDTSELEVARIYVKFRTCDNCIEFDTGSIIGIVIGDLVATAAIGVAVYLIVSHAQPGPTTSQKKSSERLVTNEMSSRAPNDHYQQLRFTKGGQKEMYDVIKNRR